MKEIKTTIANLLIQIIPDINRATLLGLITPLTTEEKAQKMLSYLENNKDNQDLMRTDKLLKVALKIGDEDKKKDPKREKLKKVWRYILKNDYSEDTVATIMGLLANTKTPEKTLNQILEILNNETIDEVIYTKLNKIKN